MRTRKREKQILPNIFTHKGVDYKLNSIAYDGEGQWSGFYGNDGDEVRAIYLGHPEYDLILADYELL